MSITAVEFPPLKIAFGAAESGVFAPGIPVLAGDALEDLFGPAMPIGRAGHLALFQAGDWLLGAATVPVTPELEATARLIYGSILQASHGQHLARIWNYIPAINEPGPGGLENYRVFCRGRSLAFEEHFGRGFEAHLPSASAVGCQSGALTVAFAACRTEPRQVENPLQVPAYDYPGDYGPRAPGFARATVVPQGERATVFISGTAAIRGHATVAPFHVREQMECTMENLGKISAACGLGPDLDQGGASSRHFKVYLRCAGDQPMVAAMLEERLLAATDRVTYLRTDLCRASLLVEIKASLFGVTGLS